MRRSPVRFRSPAPRKSSTQPSPQGWAFVFLGFRPAPYRQRGGSRDTPAENDQPSARPGFYRGPTKRRLPGLGAEPAARGPACAASPDALPASPCATCARWARTATRPDASPATPDAGGATAAGAPPGDAHLRLRRPGSPRVVLPTTARTARGGTARQVVREGLDQR